MQEPTVTDPGLRHARSLHPEQIPSLRLRRQWAILEPGDPAPDGWPAVRLSQGLVLVYHPETSIMSSMTPGQWGSILIGTAVQPLGRGGDVRPLLENPDLRASEARTSLLHSLGGMYVLIYFNADGVLIHTDPGALMAVYYGDGRAASTPALLPDLRRDVELDMRYRFSGSDDWYPGDLCPYVGVKALLANHVLDLASGQIERFWPTQVPVSVDKTTGVGAICEILRGMARGYLDAGPCVYSLTGGQDSRVNLAAVRSWVEEIEFFTIRGSHIKPCDVKYAGELANRFGLDHRFVDNEDAPGWLRELHSELCAGMETRGASSVLGACRHLASSEYTHVSGALGAITKSMFWPSKRPTNVEVSALASEFLSRSDVLMTALERWRDSIDPSLPATMVYNLMYLEQRGGRWQSVSELGSNLFYRPATLFSSRQLFEYVCAVPTEDQYGGSLLFDFTRSMWPDLLDVPYCRVTANYGTYLPKWVRVGIKRILGRPV